MSELSPLRKVERLPVAVVAMAAMLSGCAAVSHAVREPKAQSTMEVEPSYKPVKHHKTAEPTPTPSPAPTDRPPSPELTSPPPSLPSPTDTLPTQGPTEQPTYRPVTLMPNGTQRFWPRDLADTWYTSPWFDGAHPVMVGFGCTEAPYYSPDPNCPKGEGKHHGIDVDMPCGTPLYADMTGEVVPYNAPSAPGPAYGSEVLRIRGHVPGTPGSVDVVIGHTRRDLVKPGDHVEVGELLSYASDDGAPDGCHLHFEARPVGDDYRQAIDPAAYLKLKQIVTVATSPTPN